MLSSGRGIASMICRRAITAAQKSRQGVTATATVPSSCLFRPFSATNIVTSTYGSNPLDAFRDPVDRQTRGTQPVGRSWTVKELRRKSYEDLHKLWYILYKEKNMLLTEQQLSRRRQLVFPQPERFRKVQKSMGAIKQVLGERKREKIAEYKTRIEEEMQAEAALVDSIEVDGDDEKELKSREK